MVTFTKAQLDMITSTAQMISTGVEDGVVNAADSMLTALGAASILMDVCDYGTLPPDWEPDTEQIAWLQHVTTIGLVVYRDQLKAPNLHKDERLAVFEGINLMSSIRRDLMTL